MSYIEYSAAGKTGSVKEAFLSFPRSAWECIETRRSDND